MADYAWHAHETDDALGRLESDRSGLSDEEADRRRARVGPNRLMRSPPVSAWKILGDQLTSVVVYLLAAAGALSLFLTDYVEAAAIGAVLGLNTAIGFATELRARRAMEALLHFDAPRAVVLRRGHIRIVEAHVLVPGDIVELSAGQAVPADARLVSATDLRTTEAALTGESLPSAKQDDVTLDPDTPLAERANMVYKGTVIAAGIGRAVVTATGPSTELGRVGALVAGVPEERTPLERRLDALGRRLVWLALGVAGVVAGLEALQGGSAALVVETGLALAVAAVPEALPAVATIALAVGVRRMAHRHALVRRLSSVEALGSTTVICTDKTRTLTSGDMSVVRIWTAEAEFTLGDEDSEVVADRRLRYVLEVAVRASRRQALDDKNGSAATRDPIDAAIIVMAARFNIDPQQLDNEWRSLGVVPFSSERKLLATFHERDGRTIACVKGAPRRLVELSDRWITPRGEERLDPASRERLLAVNAGWARQGLRVLGLASGAIAHPAESALGGLTFIGFLGLLDPPAPGVMRTLARLREAGLRTIMVTGDQRLTAETIGRELGLLASNDQVIDGREVQHFTAEDLRARVAHVGAFSRIAPQDKLAIVTALQARGEIVAMIGDGVNDAPALKRADVGVAMGLRGTDVAKEAAAIVLQDDRFETIAAALEEGRVIYDNIQKFVFYLFSCNLAEILVLLIAGLAALPPLAPLQILWLNLVTDTFPALALAMEPGDPDVMRRPPRDPRDPLLSGAFLSSIALHGALLTTATLAAFLWALRWAPAQATTICFMTLALAQILHLGNARSHTHVLRPGRAFANPYAVAALLLSLLLQLITVSVPGLRDLLHLTALPAAGWAVVVAASATPAVIGQLMRIKRAR